MKVRVVAAVVAVGVLAGGLAAPTLVRAQSSPDLASQMRELANANGVTTWQVGDAVAPASPELTAGSLPVGASSVERVLLGTGCRVFDTRGGTTPGPILESNAKDFSVLDAFVSNQGGSASGCKIPADALAVDLSLSTVGTSPTAAGFLRAGPGGVAPTATVLQFLQGQGTSVTTTVPLNASSRLRVAAFGGSTNVVGDVLAYYRSVLNATVDSDGVLFKGTGVASVAKYAGGPGQYYVNFNRDISECVPAISGAFGLPAWGLVLDTDTVGVVTTDWAGAATDGPFHVTMSC